MVTDIQVLLNNQCLYFLHIGLHIPALVSYFCNYFNLEHE